MAIAPTAAKEWTVTPMREILFRGKKKPWGGWCEGFLVKTGDHFRISTQNDLISFGVDPDTVGQYTELTDKNGMRIFEGDICEIRNMVGIVEFKNSQWQFTIPSTKVYCYLSFYSGCNEYCEVIGNIHDNPELLR